MGECNSFKAPNIYPNLNDQQFRINKISKVKEYFIAEIKERELMSKRLSKYIASFHYFDKSLIVLSVTSGSISIASFTTVICVSVGIASASFSLAFSMSTEIVKKLFNKIVILAISKLNSIETKTSVVLINNEIIHEGFMTIINQEKNYEELKEKFRMMKSQRNDNEKINLIEEGKK